MTNWEHFEIHVWYGVRKQMKQRLVMWLTCRGLWSVLSWPAVLSKLLPGLTTRGGRTKKLNVCLQCRVCPPSINQLEQTGYKGRENYLIGFRCIIRFWQEYLIEPFQCFWMWFFLWYLLVLPFLKTKVSLNARLKHNILSILSNFLKASCTNGAHIFSKAKKKCEWQIYLFTSTSLKGERETILKFFGTPLQQMPTCC